LSASVTWLTASWPGGYTNGGLSGGVDGQVVRRPPCSELPRRFELSLLSEPSRRSEPATSASLPVGVVLGLGVVSQSPDGCRRFPVCHSASNWR